MVDDQQIEGQAAGPDGVGDLDEEDIAGQSEHFAPDQIALLNKRIDRALLKQRQQSGQTLTYIEGYTVINQANKIFGYGSWDMSVGDLKAVPCGPDTLHVAEVTITVCARDGSRSHHSDVGAAIQSGDKAMGAETAVKAAVTDAMKRAFRHFGEQFANSLYSKTYMADRDQEERGTRASAHSAAADETAKVVKYAEGVEKRELEKLDKAAIGAARASFRASKGWEGNPPLRSWTSDQLAAWGQFLAGMKAAPKEAVGAA